MAAILYRCGDRDDPRITNTGMITSILTYWRTLWHPHYTCQGAGFHNKKTEMKSFIIERHVSFCAIKNIKMWSLHKSISPVCLILCEEPIHVYFWNSHILKSWYAFVAHIQQFWGLMQKRRNSGLSTMELYICCIDPSKLQVRRKSFAKSFVEIS